MEFSPQQAMFINKCRNGKGSIILESVAGSGKTTTAVAGAKTMKGDIALVVFNKRNADEFQPKIAGNPNIKGGTYHSFGMSALRALETKSQRLKVDTYKVSNIVQALVNEAEDARLNDHISAICKMVGMAKQRAIGIIGSIDDDSLWFDMIEQFDLFEDDDKREEDKVELTTLISLAKEALRVSNSNKLLIDFDDMIYLPVLLKMTMKRYDVIFIDEAQDTNPARRALTAAMLKKGGRVIAIGDPHQAIYGFTGADNDSLDHIEKAFNCQKMALSVSFRCPKNVVEFSRKWVGHIESAPNAIEGSVSSCGMTEFFARKDLNGSSSVLCRTTAPLVTLAMQLIRQKIPCKIEGRDIGAGIKKLILKWKSIKDLDVYLVKLDEYKERMTTLFLAKKQEHKVAVLEDLVETVKVIVDQCQKDGRNTVRDASAHVDTLFGDDVKGILVLSTIHKSKGREWKNVFWLDRVNTCPSKWARQKWQQDQETNLMYVAATRAQENLIEIVL